MLWQGLGLLLLLASIRVSAEPIPELVFLSEHPVEQMPAGNLSGLARCDGHLLTLSDREDGNLHRLDTQNPVWRAQVEPFQTPEIPENHQLPWGMRAQSMLSGPVRGGQMDFEGIACDALGNRYLVSEAYASVLKITPDGQSHWLELPEALMPQARSRGLLRKHNALYEGIAVDPQGQRIWLAAEREQRGLLHIELKQEHWECPEGHCVLLFEAQAMPSGTAEASPAPDFSDLQLYQNKLFTLERQARQLCRRNLEEGTVERCWSFATTAQKENYRYPTPYGIAEALWLEEDTVLIGLDNNDHLRADGEARPIVWRFAAPAEGWMGTP